MKGSEICAENLSWTLGVGVVLWIHSKSLIWWMFNSSSLPSLVYSGHSEHGAYLI